MSGVNRRQLYKYKGDRCYHCRKTVQEMIDRHRTFNRMFEFNHVNPNEKHPDYDNLIRRVISSEQLDEVDKCVLLCCDCHAIVHAQNITAEVLVTVRVGKKTAEQKLKGQLIYDWKDKRGTFLTNECVLVFPYRVMLGARTPRVLFGTQLKKEGLLNRYLQSLPQCRFVTIRSYRGEKVLLRAEYLGDDRITIVYDMGFHIMDSELGGDNDAPTEMWVRNGIGLTKDGEVFRNGTVEIEGTLNNDDNPSTVLEGGIDVMPKAPHA